MTNRLKGFSMDDLPPSLVLEILSRLRDSADLARCRVASKALNALARDVRSINLTCTLSRYLKWRSPETKHQIIPFKAVLKRLVHDLQSVESVSIGVEKSLAGLSYDDVEDESDDLYLTDVEFAEQWLPRVCGELKSLSVSDFWIQSCWRRSDILNIISSCCHALLNLELKNAWLSVDELDPMPMVTSLTLEFIRLDDEDMDKFNYGFPCLQELNLIGVGGLKDPKIHLFHLKTCRWTVSNAPHSLSIFAPHLSKLELKCVRPCSLVIETPVLSDFFLSLEKPNKFKVEHSADLKNLHLESANLFSLVSLFPQPTTIRRLTLDSLECMDPFDVKMLDIESLLFMLPNISSLSLLSGAWSELEMCFLTGDILCQNMTRSLKKITAQLVIQNVNVTVSFILYILSISISLSDVGLLIHRDVYPNFASKIVSECTSLHPKVRWRWGMWQEDAEDVWVCDGI